MGFIIYQIDKEESDWKERLGEGFIREFYVKPEVRRQNLGSKLLQHAECVLKSLGAKQVYLTSQETNYVKLFYKKNGYTTNHVRAKNGHEYFEKEL